MHRRWRKPEDHRRRRRRGCCDDQAGRGASGEAECRCGDTHTARRRPKNLYVWISDFQKVYNKAQNSGACWAPTHPYTTNQPSASGVVSRLPVYIRAERFARMYVCGIFLSHTCNLPERACVCVALISPMKVHPARKNTWAWSPDRTFSTAMGVWLLLITKATVQGGMPRLIGTRAATLISPARLSLLIMPAAAAARAVRRSASGGHKAPAVSGIPQGGTSDGTLMPWQ